VDVQVDYNDPHNKTGAIYNRESPIRELGAEERWNRCRVQCTGTRVRVWIDGRLANDFGELHTWKGAIGLQMHGGRPHNHVVRFRNLQLL
jgi:hypothetical protein